MSENSDKFYAIQLSNIISQLFTNCQDKETRYVAKFGISLVEFRCIRILYENQSLTVNQLAHQMSLTSSRITRIIDGLVQKRLVLRESGQTDRRIYNLSLTKSGNKLAQEMIQDYAKMHEDILKSIPEENHPTMIKMLNLLNVAVKKWIALK